MLIKVEKNTPFSEIGFEFIFNPYNHPSLSLPASHFHYHYLNHSYEFFSIF